MPPGRSDPLVTASRAALLDPAASPRLPPEALALRVPEAIEPDDAADLAARIEGARPSWNDDFGGEQHSLGRPFYTHFEEGRSRDYFAGAAASDALVERVLPGFQARLRAFAAALVGRPVGARPRWCGPGVHVFPAGGVVAGRGGVVHFDTEGLPAPYLARRGPAFTLVLMLQAPVRGGGLRIWDVRYEGRDHPTAAERAAPSVVVPYGPGDLVLLDSYRLHRIQPFGGARDRISATAHVAELDGTGWVAWF